MEPASLSKGRRNVAVAIADVVEAVYPASENLVFVLIGDAELIRESVSQYGTVTEMRITEPRFRP